jgi:YHS domain-containing protein
MATTSDKLPPPDKPVPRSSDHTSPSWGILDVTSITGEGEMAIDPVCGMEVDEKTAPAKSTYQGKTYYFCAPGCKEEFDENPEGFIGEEDELEV